MIEDLNTPQWRAENQTTRFPFAQYATLLGESVQIPIGTILDASLFPVGGGAGLRIAAIEITFDQVTIEIGDDVTPLLAEGVFDPVDPPDAVELVDPYGRPAGILVSTPVRWSVLATWGVGRYLFTREATEFVASCCAPQPRKGVRGLLLDDGTVLARDVWLVGDDGVILSMTETAVPAAGDTPAYVAQNIRVDVVGDPLFRRRLCVNAGLFATPKFVKTLTFRDGHQEIVCGPDRYGDIRITANNDLAADTVLRIRPTEGGVAFGAAGAETEL